MFFQYNKYNLGHIAYIKTFFCIVSRYNDIFYIDDYSMHYLRD